MKRKYSVLPINALMRKKVRTFLSLLGITMEFLPLSRCIPWCALEKGIKISMLLETTSVMTEWPWNFYPEQPWGNTYSDNQPTIKEFKEVKVSMRCLKQLPVYSRTKKR